MSGPVPDGSKSVVPFGAKSKNVASSVADPLEAAGQTILGLVHRAASTAEKNYLQALDFTQKLSGQLKAAEDRIKALEADVRYQVDRADRAEQWPPRLAVPCLNVVPTREPFRKVLTNCINTNPAVISYIVMLMAVYLHLGPYSRYVIASIERRLTALDAEGMVPQVAAE